MPQRQNSEPEREPTRDAGTEALLRPGEAELADDAYDPVAEQQRARAARAARDRALAPEQRLQLLHRLCAQLAKLTRARPPAQHS